MAPPDKKTPAGNEKAATIEDFAARLGYLLGRSGDVTEHDGRPADGNLYDLVRLKILRQSGMIGDTVTVVKAYGGLRPPGAQPNKMPRPVLPGDLKQGRRYWLAFGSTSPSFNQWVSVIKFWPEDAPAAAKRLDQAIKDDLFVWNPQYDPQTGLVCGHRIDSKKQWRLRVEKDGKVLWQKTVPGTMAHRSESWGLWTGGRDGFPAKMPACGKIMIAETAVPLESGNEFGLSADTYYVCTGYDPETGQRLAAWVSRYQQGQVDLVHREYDPKTGHPRRETCFETLDSGGLKAGAEAEKWWRKTVRTFDPDTGKATSEETFRYDGHADAEHRWVKVRP